ncbi:MAG: universal stress protein [bacterium]|nr:universal stress protein [bacterium]
MKRVILTTDFSENAHTAVEYGLQLFGSENVTYTILNTYKEPGTSTAAMVSIADYLYKESQTMLAQLKGELATSYPNHIIETLAKHGSLYPVLNAMSKNGLADYVVVGTRGASQVQNFFLGSNTMDVLKNVAIPTVIVPKDCQFNSIKNIALAVDFKPLENHEILSPMLDLARSQGAEVLAFHIQENGDDEMSKASPEVVALFNTCGDIPHNFENIKNENVAAGIGSYMNASNADLLAIVARKHNFLERLFQKSITKEVSLLASFPMLIVREK